MSNALSRRKFLQAGALAAASCVVSGCAVNLQRTEYLESAASPPEEGLPGESLWYASACRQCSAGCGIMVRMSNGRARKIEGNPLHPVNRGKLCAQGQAILQELYDPDRLPGAVRQVERGTQNFEPIYWETAVPELAEQLRRASAGSVAFLGGNLSTHLWTVVSRFSQALGSRPPVIYGLGSALSGEQALTMSSERLFGRAAVPYYDLGKAQIVFSFGANLFETWISPVLYGRAFAEKRRGLLGQRGLLVQFEPRLSSTGTAADEWVPIRPGSEGLVALGLGKLIVDGGLGGDAQFAALYQAVNMDQVVEASGVPITELNRLARTFAALPGVMAIPGSSVAAHEDGAAAMAAVQALNLLTGRLGQPGGLFLPPEPAGEAFTPAPLSTYADVQALISDMAAGRVAVLLIHGTNPVFELPPASGFIEALANVPLVVSFSSSVDETAALSDLILPDHTNLEGWGYHVPVVADRTVVTSQQPIMRPLHQTRATVDVLLALAAELGGSLSQALPWPNEVEFLMETVGTLGQGGTTPEGFWTQWRRTGGFWPEEAELQTPTLSSGSPELTAAAGEGATGDFPLYLHLTALPTLYDGHGANKPWLQEVYEPMTTLSWQTWVEVHPETAAELGVKDRDVVRVISAAGEVEAIVYVSPGLRREVVAMPIGRGHEHYGRFAKGKGTNPLRLLASTTAGDTGLLTWAGTRVRIEPTGQSKALARFESAAGVEYLLEGH